MDDPSANTQALPAGTRLEEFIIERVIGSGGFGITYLARDTGLNRQVVIKENLPAQFAWRETTTGTVRPRHTSGGDADDYQWSMNNFLREAETLASLDHPGIVRVLRKFEANGTAYFVMPFVDGLALDTLIEDRSSKNKPFTEEELRGLLDRLLAALGYLHDRGIYHRDIKPGNILISNDGVPALIDFGSARQRLSERSMTVIESAGYTPFEQLQSRGNVGPWSDLYALGGTLVKALTGEALPKANDRVFDDPWQELALRADLLGNHSDRFLRSVDRALGLHPRDRWQDAGEWMKALSESAAPEARVIHAPPAVAPMAPTPTAPAPVVPPVPLPVIASEPQPGEERDFDLTENTKVRMCWIPQGGFVIGSPEGEWGRQYDESQHRVQITRGFWMGKYPVTQAQWLAVMETHPSSFGGMDLKTIMNHDACQRHMSIWDRHPVESISWDDICGSERRDGGFLGKVNANSIFGWRFDLPTEAEWEYGCRAGAAVSLVDRQTPQYDILIAVKLAAAAWYCQNSGNQTRPVGLKNPNGWGLHDMQGNVWEWCADWYATYPTHAVADPQGPDLGICRILRGGGWGNDVIRCRVACRDYNYPNQAHENLGFRLVLRPVP